MRCETVTRDSYRWVGSSRVQFHVSPEVSKLLDAAVAISVRHGQFFVGVDHLFEALLDASALLPKAFMDRYVSVLHTVSRELLREAWHGGTFPASGEVFYTPRCAETLASATKLSERQGYAATTAGHLLLALLADVHAGPSRALDRLNLGRGEMIVSLRDELARAAGQMGGESGPESSATPTVKVPAMAGSEGNESESAFATLTRDLTEAARRSVLQRAVGRENEMFQVLQILARKNKNNVMLVGEAGVGKTQIVEGLAVAGVRGGLGGILAGYRILELNLGALLSGTQYRGSLEKKLLALLEEVKRSKDVILFIDEFHLVMGAAATGGDGVDIANLLKPTLARGEIRCIGATTLQEYRRFVEKDPAIERRFQMVRVEPLDEAATLEVLERLAPSLERHHGVHISRRAMEAAVTLTQRYMPNRHLPDKAIDVLDQACARYRLKTIAARNRAERGGRGSSRAAAVDKVTPHDIRKVISQITAIPIEEMTAEERLFLSNLERDLKDRIIGQDEAVARTVAAVKKARTGLTDPNRPDAVLLFLGPTGVGKTQLAKALAEALFGSPDHLVTFDMSEYIEEHSVSRLLGAPPGYVGSEEEGRLTAAVRNAPFSVLLFDEIEKAHGRIFDVLLPVFDEGRLKDARGREVSFRNCIIIMTSNVGAAHVSRNETQESRGRLMDELRRHFRPEFINRIDEIVPFHPLLFEDVRTILSLSIREVARRLKEKGIRVHIYQGAYEYLAHQGYSAEFGARELRRTVDRLVVTPVSDMIVEQEFQSGDIIDVLMEGDKLVVRKGLPREDKQPHQP